jgi:hypothetical protein
MQVFKILLPFLETFQNWPGSRLITTRRFAHEWQDETLGVTQLLNPLASDSHLRTTESPNALIGRYRLRTRVI